MNRILVTRDVVAEEYILGRMDVNGVSLFTIERPWIPSQPDGTPFQSCVPSGRYRCEEVRRPNGDKVLVLINSGLAVFHHASDRPKDVGRYLILVHAGNWVKDVVGCIAPGLGRDKNKGMVTSSRRAMEEIWKALSPELPVVLDIVWANHDLQGVPYA